MKQRITVDQLNELSPEEKDKLRELWKPEPGNRYCNETGISFTLTEWESIFTKSTHGEKYYPLLDIGQMIELLEEVTKGVVEFYYCELGSLVLRITDKDQELRASLKTPIFVNKYSKATNLCDALFEAVKSILRG